MRRIIDLEIGEEVQVETGYTNWNRADNEFYCTVSGISEDRMIFLLGEMNDTSCSQQNPYEDAYFEAVQKLMEPRVEHADGSSTHRYPDLKEYPEYRELHENYHAEERRLNQYRLDCKQEFFELFSTHFYDLWD